MYRLATKTTQKQTDDIIQ